MSSPTVRWGVLGAAHIARKAVIPAMQRAHNSTVQALASYSHERAQVFAQAFAIPTIYTDYADLLADPQIDAVYIPLPNHLHREWALRALHAGKHVLCEKPLAMNADEARDIVTVAHATGMLLMEAFMYRFHPRNRRIKELVDQGTLGDLRLIHAAFCFALDRPPDNYRLQAEMGGGALLDVGCYGVNVARWMCGAEPEAVQASAVYGPGGIDLTTVGMLRFPGDRIAVVESSFVTALQQTYTLAGTAAAIEVLHNAFVPGEDAARFRRRAATEAEGTVETIPGTDQYRHMVEHFAGAVLGRHALAFAPEDSIATMSVLDALARAARTGTTQHLTR